MRRLFSTFAGGFPGVGLLLMRLVGGSSCVAVVTQQTAASAGIAVTMLGVAAGLFLLAGLWTPIGGCLAVAIGIWFALSDAANLLAGILLATIGGGLAFVGPGAWSVDARLFGWKRIDVGDQTR